MPREYLEGTSRQEERAFSPAVITNGGKQVWLAGVGRTVDEEGNELHGDFAAQAHASLRTIGEVLERAGGTLNNIVTMTVFILDVRHGDQFTAIRKEYYPENAPASALITVKGFARPEMMVEIQAIAVIGDE